jgi:hypothetical protein
MTFIVGRLLTYAITATAGSGFLLWVDASYETTNGITSLGYCWLEQLASAMTRVWCPVCWLEMHLLLPSLKLIQPRQVTEALLCRGQCK